MVVSYTKTIYTGRRITTPKIDAVNRGTKITKQNVFCINRAFEKPSTKHFSYAIDRSYSSFNIKFIRKNTSNCNTKVFNTIHKFNMLVISDVVETLMVETETKTETWKKFESKTRDQDLKRFSRPRSRLGEFFETETRLRDPRF